MITCSGLCGRQKVSCWPDTLSYSIRSETERVLRIRFKYFHYHSYVIRNKSTPNRPILFVSSRTIKLSIYSFLISASFDKKLCLDTGNACNFKHFCKFFYRSPTDSHDWCILFCKAKDDEQNDPIGFVFDGIHYDDIVNTD
jgi:hypothetical protein